MKVVDNYEYFPNSDALLITLAVVIAASCMRAEMRLERCELRSGVRAKNLCSKCAMVNGANEQ